jgi:hypothetical protein
MKANSKLGNFNKFLAVLLVLAIIFLVLVVTVIKPGGAYEAAPVDANAAGDADVATIDELVPGTYGGIEFNTIDDVVNYYVQCYNYTKTLTAQYNDNGTTATYYKLLGMEDLTIENLLVEGKSNDVVNKLVPSILGSVFTGGLKGLPPCGNISPTADQVGDGIDVTKSLLTAEDVLAANVVDNGDGTINITIQPKGVVLSMPGSDAQGHFFNTLGDISSTVESISVLSFSSGTINDNFVVDYKGGSGTVKIDTATGEILSGDYTMRVHIDVQHANVAILKDKSASLDIVYTNTFPATTEQLTEKGITAA